MMREDKELYEFESFVLDVGEHTLTRTDGSKNSSLPEKAFQTLVTLVRNRGRLLTKQELIDQIWPDSFVEENNLDKCVHAIRHVLGEKPGEDKFVETVRKHGYRFVAHVTRLETQHQGAASLLDSEFLDERKVPKGSSQPVISTATTNSGAFVVSAKWSRELDENKVRQNENHAVDTVVADPLPILKTNRRILWLSVAVILLLAGSAAIVYFLIYRSTDNTPAGSSKSIAVLPLKSVNTANRDELYEIGIADSLIHRLSSIKGFIVRPLSAMRKYADIEKDPLEAGHEQRVDYVLASNYQLAGGKIKITSQLLNVANGQVEETYKSEKDADNIFAMQDLIANEVANVLLVRFAITSGGATVKRGTKNEEAYKLYLQGMYLYGKRTQQASVKAVELLEEAVRLDPTYALAWAGKAHAHRYRANLGRDTDPHAEYQSSIKAINEAIFLDKDLSEAYSALCENKYYYEFDFTGAETQCLRAISLDPNSSLAHEIYGRFLYHRGRFDEGISEMKTAVALEPTSLFNQRNLGIAFYYSRRYEEAVAQFKRVIEMDETFISAYMWLRNALEMQGNYSEAFDWLMKAQRVSGADEETIRLYDAAYQTSGYQGVLQEHAKFHANYNQLYIGAILNAQIGDKDKAFEFLERSYQRREWGMNSLLIEPHFDSLRDDPRFEQLIQRVGLR